ncbi:MAG: glycosyltransferase [Pseudomonadales bacterium]|jgi:glycosyltransferase involved in cell wall biosynthesis|nr:glycosyltransferase [Pseudomonadales bacterium]
MSQAEVFKNFTIAVLLPCLNEEKTIASVVANFRAVLPSAQVFVFDNGSTDDTALAARQAGAVVKTVREKGKGNVVRRMFADVEADIYLMADGDLTYDSAAAPLVIAKLVEEGWDMAVGCRQDDESEQGGATYRKGHRFGNWLLTTVVGQLFGGHFSDMLSGYRAFTRRFVKSFPAQSRGFEIETELTIHALEQRMPYGELVTRYFSRPTGSTSKLSTWKDGFKILKMIARLFMVERPLAFYSVIAALLIGLSVLLSLPLFSGYWQTGLVPRIPTAILCVGLVLTGVLALVLGLMLDGISINRQEIRRLAYLATPLLQAKKEQ